MEKTCVVCLVTKTTADFYKHPRMSDGFLSACKDCHKKSVIKNRLKNVEKYREYDRNRANLPHRVALALEEQKRWRREDKRRMQCHSAVARALMKGVVVPTPCFVCGNERTVAHHPSYDLPLDVVWLCQAHHVQLHVEHRMNTKTDE